MFKKMKKLFTKHTSNQNGSVLSVSLIVVALLSFSIATITTNTVNLSTQTTEIQENVEGTYFAKKLIDMAITDTKEFIIANPSTDPSDMFFSHSMDETMLERYAVVVEDHTAELGFDESMQVAFYFMYEFSDGSTIARYSFYLLDPSTSGVTGGIGNEALAEILDDPAEGAGIGGFPYDGSPEEMIDWILDQLNNWIFGISNDADEGFDPTNPFEVNFYFSLATDGDLFANGGLYDIPAVYARNIYSGKTSAYRYNDDWYVTPQSYGQYPDFSEQETKIFVDEEYKFCPSTTACMTASDDRQTVIIHESNYSPIEDSGFTDQGDLQSIVLDEFFSTYDFAAQIIYMIENDAPTDLQTLTDVVSTYDLEGENPLTVLLNYADEGSLTRRGAFRYPDSEFVLIDDGTDNDIKDKALNDLYFGASILYDGDLTLTQTLDLGSDDDKLIVLGDLTIDMDYEDQEIHTDIIVTGDINFVGTSVKVTSTLVALGETIIDFDPGNGFEIVEEYSFLWGLITVPAETTEYFTLLSKDNIRIYNLNSSNSPTENDAIFMAFLYTEESILIDAVNSNINLNGSMYARALGETDNPLPFTDLYGDPFEGIFINSFWGSVSSTNELNPTGANEEAYTRFQMTYISNNDHQAEFDYLPYFEVTVVGQALFIDAEFFED
jgi:hypothetical protein